jgi:hypothetical protein
MAEILHLMRKLTFLVRINNIMNLYLKWKNISQFIPIMKLNKKRLEDAINIY